MNYTIKLLKEINSDISKAMNWDMTHQNNISKRFVTQLAETIDYLGSNPKLFPRKYKDIRLAKVSLYPFHVFFTINETSNEVIILAILHTGENSDLPSSL